MKSTLLYYSSTIEKKNIHNITNKKVNVKEYKKGLLPLAAFPTVMLYVGSPP